jgi:cyanophycinase-like exopeptidase
MKKGYLVFNGGDSFTPEMRGASRVWLRYVRPEQSKRVPRVVVVPVAAMDKHQKIAYQTCQHFGGLNTKTDYKLVTSQQLADTATEYEVLFKVDVIVLTDGSVYDMIERVQGTHTEDAFHAVLERRAVLVGTGASAMALGGVYWFGGEWLPGLSVAPHLAILPHHNVVGGRYAPERLLRDLPEGVTLIGVDQATYLICHPDDSYEVAGEGTVTVYRSVTEQRTYRRDTTFRLEPNEKPAEPPSEALTTPDA